MRPHIGQIVLVDPEDKLEIRDKESYLGTVLKVDRYKSTILIRDGDKKITVSNKYLYPIEMNDDAPPCPLVERSYPRVRINERDISKLDTVMKLVESEMIELLPNMNKGKAKDLIDCVSFCKANILSVQSKLRRLISTQRETEIMSEFLDRYHQYAVEDEENDPRDITDDNNDKEPNIPSIAGAGSITKERANEFAQEMLKRLAESTMDGSIFEYEEDTVLNQKILDFMKEEWVKLGPTVSDKVKANLENAKKTMTMFMNQMVHDPKNKHLFFSSKLDEMLGYDLNMSFLIGMVSDMFNTSSIGLIKIPVLIVLDPTELIRKLRIKYKDGFTEYEDFIHTINTSDGDISDFIAKEGLKYEEVIDTKAIPIFPFDGPITPKDVKNTYNDLVESVCETIYNLTDIELGDDDEIERASIHDSVHIHLPVNIIGMMLTEGGTPNE